MRLNLNAVYLVDPSGQFVALLDKTFPSSSMARAMASAVQQAAA